MEALSPACVKLIKLARTPVTSLKERLYFSYFVKFLENLREIIVGLATSLFCGKAYMPGYVFKDGDLKVNL